jgi:FkbM family methyltransferase
MLTAASKSQWPADCEAQILAFFKGKTDGFFVDIGALNGFDASNTRALWLSGWSGFMVEADSRAFAELVENYGINPPRLRLVESAVCEKDGPVTFYEIKPAPTWSSMDLRWVKRHGFSNFTAKTVNGVRIGSLGLPDRFDLLKIDTEGLDSLIVESMPTNMCPTLIVAEVNKEDGSDRIERCLQSRGYGLVWGDAENVGYALP